MAMTTKQGDRRTWTFVIREGGSPKSLAAASGVTITMKDSSGTKKIDDGACVIDPNQTANPGRVTYSPSGDDVDTAGDFTAEFEVSWTDGSPSSLWPSDSYEIIHILSSLQ